MFYEFFLPQNKCVLYASTKQKIANYLTEVKAVFIWKMCLSHVELTKLFDGQKKVWMEKYFFLFEAKSNFSAVLISLKK